MPIIRKNLNPNSTLINAKSPNLGNIYRQIIRNEDARGGKYIYWVTDRKLINKNFSVRMVNMFDDDKTYRRFIAVPSSWNYIEQGVGAWKPIGTMEPDLVRLIAENAFLKGYYTYGSQNLFMVVNSVSINRRLFDGSSLRRFNVAGLRSLRGMVASRKYFSLALGAILYYNFGMCTDFIHKRALPSLSIPQQDDKQAIMRPFKDPRAIREILKGKEGLLRRIKPTFFAIYIMPNAVERPPRVQAPREEIVLRIAGPGQV